MKPRGTLGLCCVHIAQLVTHPAVYTLPFTLQFVTSPLALRMGVEKQKNFLSPINIFENNQKRFS